MKKKFTFLMTAMALILAIMGPRNVAWGQTREDLTLTFDLSSNPGGWPTVNSTTLTNYTYTLGGTAYTFALKNVKCNSGYLMMTSTAVLGLPAIENYKLTKVVAKNSGGCSTATKVGISSSSSSASYISGGGIQTWSTTSSSYTYNLTGTETNTMYYIYVTNKNAQIVELELTYASTGTTPTVAAPTFNPAADTYYEDKTIELSAEDGCTIYYTLDSSTPTAESTPYSTPIQLTVPSTTTIKAIAVDGENNSSNVASATYILKRSQYTPAQLLAEVEPDNQSYIVVFTDEVIKSFYVYNNNNAGFYIETTEGDFLVYKSGTPSNWEVGGKVSGTVSGTWKTYNNLKEFCPADYNGFSYTPPTQQLPAPTGLTVSDLSRTGATLSWDAVEHASSYTVQVIDGLDYNQTFEGITTNSIVLDRLSAGIIYSWTVKAIGDGEIYLDSEESEPAEFTTPTTTLYNVTIVPADGGTIKAQIDGEDITQAANGTTVNLVATPNTHFTFTSWNVYGTEEPYTAITVTDNAFTMPDYNVTITATFTEHPKYTVTYAKGGEDVVGDDPGTVSYYVNDVVILEENPYTRTGFTFNGWQVKNAEENDVTVDEGMFEMPASNVTVTATWAKKTPATITLMDKGAQYGETINGYVGDNLLATLTAAEVENPTGLATMPDYEFAGWAQSNSAETPNIVTEETTITDDATLYAIYANIISGTTTYPKVNSLSDIVAGRWVIVNDGYALPSTTTGSSTPPVKSNDFKVTVSDNQISSTVSANMIWNFAISEGKATITNSGNDYLYAINDNNGLRVSTTEDTWTFETNSTGFAMKDSSKSRYCATYKSGSDWRSYTSKDHSNYGDSGILYLYKENTTPDIIIYDFEESAKIYTVTYDANGAEGEVPVETMLFAQGDEYILASAEGLTKEHHTFAGWKASTDEQTYTVGSTYTFGSASVTFTAQWTEDETYTVSYHVNGAVSTNDVYAGEMQLPVSVTAPNGYTFVGWTNQQIPGVAESATYFSSYNVIKDVDLYAVFAITEGGGDAIYAKVTEEPADWSGDYLLVYEGEDDAVAWTGADESNCYVEVTIANDEIAGTEGAAVLTIAPMDGGYSIQVNEGRYIGQDKYDNGIKFSNDAQLNTISLDDNNAVITAEGANNQRPTMRYNKTSGQDRFRYYKSGQQSVQLYKYSAPSTTYSNFCTTVKALSGTITQSNITANTAYYISDVTTINGSVEIAALGNTNASLLIIEDGDQLIHHNAGVQATMRKEVRAYSTTEGVNDGWYFVASPMAVLTSHNLNNDTFDLYKFEQSADKEWKNYESTAFSITNKEGYLYANAASTTIEFVGTLNATDGSKTLAYENVRLAGFNLIGNPFACNANIGTQDFYICNGENIILAENSTIAPCTGIMVKANTTGESVTFVKGEETTRATNAMDITIAKATRNANTIDRARINFSGDSQLSKFFFNENSCLYIPQNGEDFAVVAAQNEGELPVNFKAEKNGTYTISVNTENVEANYLHLIDNLTGMDTDLLSTPSYTFDAKTSDYTSRFKLVFGVKNDNEEMSQASSFAYINNGEIVISNEGRATLQVIDVLGRIVSSEEINGEARISTNGLTAGVYVLNLNGNVQKIVVR